MIFVVFLRNIDNQHANQVFLSVNMSHFHEITKKPKITTRKKHAKQDKTLVRMLFFNFNSLYYDNSSKKLSKLLLGERRGSEISFVQKLVRMLILLVLKIDDPLLDGILHDKAIGRHHIFLADAVGSVRGLILHRLVRNIFSRRFTASFGYFRAISLPLPLLFPSQL